jgi:hypothetical protein
VDYFPSAPKTALTSRGLIAKLNFLERNLTDWSEERIACLHVVITIFAKWMHAENKPSPPTNKSTLWFVNLYENREPGSNLWRIAGFFVFL